MVCQSISRTASTRWIGGTSISPPRANATLVPGTYLNATRYPFQAANVPGLDVSGEGRGSNTLTGQFTIVQALYERQRPGRSL